MAAAIEELGLKDLTIAATSLGSAHDPIADYIEQGKVVGIQTSLISTVSEETTGLQFSLVNFSVKVAGVQLGIVNVADDESLQIGLLNFIKNSPVFCLPIVNVRL